MTHRKARRRGGAGRGCGMDAQIEGFRRQRRRTFYPKTDTDVPDEVLRSAADARRVPAAVVADVCRSALGVEAVAVAPLGRQGTFHHLTRAALADGRRVVVRVNALGEHVRDLALGVDAWAMRRLRDQGLPWLEVACVDVTRRAFPFEFEILAEAPGVELATFYDDARLGPLLGRLGAFLARVHDVRVDGFGWIDLDPRAADPAREPGRGLFASWRDFVLTNLDAHLATCTRIGAITPPQRRRIESVFAERDGLLGGVEPSLLHGDLSGRNVFTDGERITAVIDWEDGLAGDPAFDLAFWATFHPEEHHPALLSGYRPVRPLPADFPARFWLYFLRVALSKTVQRHRFGYPDRVPGRPPASRRIALAVERLAGTGWPTVEGR